MAKTVVGLFEDGGEAQAARSDLERMGLGAETTTFVQQHEPELTSRLVDAGIPQHDAQLFSDGVGQGYLLIVVQGVADADAAQVAAIMDRHNVIDITRMQSTQQRTASTATRSMTGSASASNRNQYDGQDVVVPIVEEQLRIGKRAVERGGVRIRTHVEEVPVSEQVTLRDETVQVERRPVNRTVTDADLAAMHDETIEVRETDEQAVVAKEAHVVEEVVVRKDATERTETVQDTVRRTDVDVDQLGGQAASRAVPRGAVAGGTGTVNVETSSTTDEGAIERGASTLGNAAERATGADLDRDGDVGQRDPRNNI